MREWSYKPSDFLYPDIVVISIRFTGSELLIRFFDGQETIEVKLEDVTEFFLDGRFFQKEASDRGVIGSATEAVIGDIKVAKFFEEDSNELIGAINYKRGVYCPVT